MTLTGRGTEALYPFLYADSADLDAVRAEVSRSTAAKAQEIIDLRASLAQRHGARLVECAHRLAASFAAGATLYTFGNGGSSTDAQDIAQLFLHPPAPSRPLLATPAEPAAVKPSPATPAEPAYRPSPATPAEPAYRPLPAISLTHDVAVLTALSNDIGFEVVFARQLAAFARAGDIAFGLSTSGGSANAVRAFTEAARLGLVTVGMAGYDGGPMAEPGLVDYLFVVPSSSVHRIQEAQTTLYHVLWELTQQALAGNR